MVGAQADSCRLRCSLGLAAETAQQVKPCLLLPEQIIRYISELPGHCCIISWHLLIACGNEHGVGVLTRLWAPYPLPS